MKEVLKACLAADVPVIMWGPPGTGKTAIVHALAREAGAHLEVLIGSTVDPIDVGGYLLPEPDKAQVVSAPPPWAIRLKQALASRQPSWLFLDELSCSPPAVRAALLRVIHDRKVGELDMAGTRILAASNPTDTAADGGELDPATANRLAHLDWVPDPAEWVRGTLGGWGAPLSAAQAKAASSVAEFIRRHPQSLLAVPKGAQAGRAWPSPRSWTQMIQAVAQVGVKSPHAASLAHAIIGPVASEWAEFVQALDLPDPEDILTGKAKLPTRGDQVHAAISAAIAAALSAHPQRETRIGKAWALLASVRPDVALSPAQVLLDASGEVPEVAVELAKRIRGVA